MRSVTLLAALVCAMAAAAQDSDSELKIKALRDWGREGSANLDKAAAYLVDGDPEVRRAAVKAVVEMGSQRSLDPLIRALKDPDGEVQIRAIDGIVNFYFPGYAERGMSSKVRSGRVPSSEYGDENTQVIDPDMTVRDEIVNSLGALVTSASYTAGRSAAARALGMLRGKQAASALLAGLQSRDDGIMLECLAALRKLEDLGNGPRVVFLVRDLSPKIQQSAIRTTGLLRTREAVPELRRVLEGGPNKDIRREVYLALGRIADPSTRNILVAGLEDRDEEVRAGSAEGLGRIGDQSDIARLESYYAQEGKWSPRLAAAFSLARFGKTGIGDDDPLRYLVNALNQRSWRSVAQAYLNELARRPEVRDPLYKVLYTGSTKEERMGLATAFAGCKGKDAAAVLERLSRDEDAEVGREALRALRILRSSL